MTAIQRPTLDVITHSPDQTRKLGGLLARMLQGSDLILVGGGIGSGKTTFVQGIAGGLGVKTNVLSPTFTIVMEHDIPGGDRSTDRLYHVDLYRVEQGASELHGFGFEEYLDDENAITVIEWPERAGDELPRDYLLVEIDGIADTKRRVRFLPSGERYRAIAERVKNEVTGSRG